MAYYQKVKGPGSSTANTNINLNLYAVNSSQFPTSGGTYACSTSNAAPYDFTNGATNYYTSGSRIYSNYGGSYTLTTTVTGAGNIASFTVSKGTSPERGSGANASVRSVTSPSNTTYTNTVYRADNLTASATAKAASTSYNFTTLGSPSVTSYNSSSITVKNLTGYTCDVYRGSTKIKTSLANNSSYTDSGLSSGTQYSYTFKSTNTKTTTTYTAVPNWSTLQVTGTPNLTITGTASSATATGYEVTSTNPTNQSTTSSSTTVTVYLRGTYASQYQGKIYVKTGGYSGTNVSGWPKTVSSGTANNSSIGTFTATTGTTYYLSGDTYSTLRYDYTIGSTTTISNNQMLATVTRTAASISCGCVRQGVQLEEL